MPYAICHAPCGCEWVGVASVFPRLARAEEAPHTPIHSTKILCFFTGSELLRCGVVCAVWCVRACVCAWWMPGMAPVLWQHSVARPCESNVVRQRSREAMVVVVEITAKLHIAHVTPTPWQFVASFSLTVLCNL